MGARTKFRVDGVPAAVAKLRKFGVDGVVSARSATYTEAEEVMAESQVECPVASGHLRDSARIIEVPNGAGGTAQELSYNEPYAYAVHEKVDVPHAPPTKAKYLEDPLNRHSVGFNERVAKRMRSDLGT